MGADGDQIRAIADGVHARSISDPAHPDRFSIFFRNTNHCQVCTVAITMVVSVFAAFSLGR